MKMVDVYNIIHWYIYVISIGDKYLPINSKKNTGNITTPVHRKK